MLSRRRQGCWAAPLLFACALAAAAATGPGAGVAAAPAWWRPARYNKDGSFTRFQYQLSDEGTITYVPGVQVYAIDFDTASTQLKALKKKDRSIRVICYFSAGSYEQDREDLDCTRRGILPANWTGLLGKTMDGWPRERWVDVRSPRLRAIMLKRLQWAQSIGCDGIDPDNVNGDENDTGLKLSTADLIAYNKWLANTAHGLGMGIGLKNAQPQIPAVHRLFDWAINEECFSFSGDCDNYGLFARRKPIWGIQYCDTDPVLDPACFCPKAAAAGLNFIYKSNDLSASGISCTKFCQQNQCKARPNCAARFPGRACRALPAGVPAL